MAWKSLESLLDCALIMLRWLLGTLGRCVSLSGNTGVSVCSCSVSYWYMFPLTGTVKTKEKAWNNDSSWRLAVEGLR
ncbi:hypothetical protein ANCDUO_12294 [Ancylostoma duodenale]|uniref:Secreted protein n=1 Tax=Ancylostoma duodenale TaxID=51022 RepID=A0A0C2CLR4_9BILA|nr:hypothetical protein ANCDUO_12294 [Ancylostoma duodenale]